MFILPTGVPGLALEDLAPVVYRNGLVDADRLANCLDTDLGDGYLRIEVPDAGGLPCCLTWQVPGGSSGSYEWPVLNGSEFRILPYRVSGITLADLTIRSFVSNIEETGITWALTELAALDYRLSGWPIETLGRPRLLTVEYGGLLSVFQWTESPAPRSASKEAIAARADLKKDGRPVLYRPAPPPVDSITGEKPIAGLVDVQTYAIVEGLGAKFQVSAGPFGHPTGSIITGAAKVTLPSIDFTTPPEPGALIFVGPSGQTTHPIEGGAGVQQFRVVDLGDTVAEVVDDILYIVLVSR